MNSNSSQTESDSGEPSLLLEQKVERLTAELEIERRYRSLLCCALLTVWIFFLALLPGFLISLEGWQTKFWSGMKSTFMYGPYGLVPTITIVLRRPWWQKLVLLFGTTAILRSVWIFWRQTVLDPEYLPDSSPDNVAFICLATVITASLIFTLRFGFHWTLAERSLATPPSIASLLIAMISICAATAFTQRISPISQLTDFNILVADVLLSFSLIPGLTVGVALGVSFFLVCGKKPISRFAVAMITLALSSCILFALLTNAAVYYVNKLSTPFPTSLLLYAAGAMLAAFLMCLPIVGLLRGARLKRKSK